MAFFKMSVQVGGKRYRLSVQKDITAYQVMQITQLFFCLQRTNALEAERVFRDVFKETSEHWVEVPHKD